MANSSLKNRNPSIGLFATLYEVLVLALLLPVALLPVALLTLVEVLVGKGMLLILSSGMGPMSSDSSSLSASPSPSPSPLSKVTVLSMLYFLSLGLAAGLLVGAAGTIVSGTPAFVFE